MSQKQIKYYDTSLRMSRQPQLTIDESCRPMVISFSRFITLYAAKDKKNKMKKLLWALIPLFAAVSLGAFPCAPAPKELAGTRIILDPGCGGADWGTVRESLGLKAKDINLDVALRVRELLGKAGAAVAMTRNMDANMSAADRYEFANEYIFKDGKRADAFVSIHTNSLADAKTDGTTTYYATEDGGRLAMAMHPVVYQALKDIAPVPPEQFTDFGAKQTDQELLRKMEFPSVMVYSICLSHPEEAISLVEPIYKGDDDETVCDGCRREQVAQAIYKGLLSYFTSIPK